MDDTTNHPTFFVSIKDVKHLTMLTLSCKVKTEHFDIIFSDVVLPDGSGLDLLDKVHRYLIDVPFVVITASDDKELIQNAMRKGATDFLSKPFNLKNIPN